MITSTDQYKGVSQQYSDPILYICCLEINIDQFSESYECAESYECQTAIHHLMPLTPFDIIQQEFYMFNGEWQQVWQSF